MEAQIMTTNRSYHREKGRESLEFLTVVGGSLALLMRVSGKWIAANIALSLGFSLARPRIDSAQNSKDSRPFSLW